MKKILLFVFLLGYSAVFSQEFEFEKADFTEVSKSDIEALSDEGGLLLYDQKVELKVGGLNDMVTSFNLVHYQQYVASDSSAAAFQKVLARDPKDEHTVKQKLRIIKPNGQVVNFSNDSIKEFTNEQAGFVIHYFDVEGMEKGSVVEYVGIWSEDGVIDGVDVKLQSDVPVIKSKFELIYPDNIIIKMKAYNGLNTPVYNEEAYNGKSSYVVEHNNLEAMISNDEYTNLIKNIKFLRYKVDGIYGGVEKDFFNYKFFVDDFLAKRNRPLSNQELSVANDFYKKVRKSDNLMLSLRNIEFAIKSSVVISPEELKTLDRVISEHTGHLTDVLRLYDVMFKNLGVKYELVLTTKKNQQVYDASFPTRLNFTDALFYFPSLDAYMDPFSYEYFIPLSNTAYHHNQGLFVTTREFAGMETIAYDNKQLSLNTFETKDVFKAEVDLRNLNQVSVKTQHSISGERGIDFQKYFLLLNSNTIADFKNFLAKAYSNDATDFNIDVKNTSFDDYAIKPFVFNVNYKADHLFEQTEGAYIFKVGKLIGDQVRLEAEEERLWPIELTTAVDYKRTITVQLPKGYKVENLKDLNIHEKLKVDGKIVGEFKSSYKVKDDILSIDCIEIYDFVEIDKKYWQEYRTVINAAAVFNDVKLKFTAK
ncbi:MULTISPECIES: DUF3857 domain-containing protein [Myroides]|uniref:DUF3857 domain-containing protein n=1 Tax=Myroides albus TaxID=2562892 RepID=A0A6I3LN71_9FLAO|nr:MULTISPECIES: DUF3857 domain-containing protein [Myroides]MTG97622.1 DUF3857 domain-containing protein [Myroides albus]MVX36758.1 DUF3857 domain-containing protein [Myroides sp. LoEW2-1]UVD79246.1 DUF3857 domain-containing protein [Myroides albus]